MAINVQVTPSLNPNSVPSKPVSRASKTPGPSRPQSRLTSHQPTPSDLKAFGIRVRDFAYESTLPPLPTIYRHPQQVQPGVARPLERKVTEPDDSQSQTQSQTNRKLERTVTEPVTEPATPANAGGFLGAGGQNSTVNSGQLLKDGIPERQAGILNESSSRDADSAKAPTMPFLSSTSRNTTSQADAARSQPQGARIDSGTPNSSAQTPSISQPLPAAPSSRPPSRPPPAASSSTSNQRALRSRGPILRTTSVNDLNSRLNAPRYYLRKRPPPAPVSPPKPSKRPRQSDPSQSSTRSSRLNPTTKKPPTSPARNKDSGETSTSLSKRQSTAKPKTRRKRS